MKNDNENKPSCLLLFLLFMIAVVVGTIVNGWVLSILWGDRKSTRLNSSHIQKSRMPSSA